MSLRTSTWSLAGALLASLVFNVRAGLREPVPEPPPPVASCQLVCEVDLAAIGVDEEQAVVLERTCASPDAALAEAGRRAAAASGALAEALRDPDADADGLRRMARELGELRNEELERCVEAILAVRGALTREQLGRLLDTCGAGAAVCLGD